MNNRLKYFYILLLVALFFSCNRKVDEREKIVVAKVGETYLYQCDIAKVVSKNTNSEDSAIIVRDYIKKWVKQQLLVEKAKQNLSANTEEIEKKINEYRNSLIIYQYKNELTHQKMDTVISDSEISDYYNEHIANFRLNKNIVKATYVKIPLDVADKEKLKLYCENTSEEGLKFLDEYCLQFAAKYDIFLDNWVDFKIISNNLAKQIDDERKFLKKTIFYEESDNKYYSLVVIHGYHLQGEDAPEEYVKKDIKNMILNKRKIDFLKEIEENIYKEGIKNNRFKIYN